MTNRQKLIETNIYDLLCNINKNLAEVNPNGACIMKALNANYNYKCEYILEYNCGDCIQNWLNEEAE